MNAPLKMDLFDAQQGLSFLLSQVSHIEREVYEIQYPDIQYPNLIPVDTSANEWARTVTYFSTDKVGEADWVTLDFQALSRRCSTALAPTPIRCAMRSKTIRRR